VKKRTRPAPSNRERLTEDDLLRRLLALLLRYRGLVRITILRNIALLTHALLTLFQGARGGNGWLSQAAIARCLPLEIGPKGRQLRFFRFLTNPRVVPETLIPLHVALVCGLQLVRERLPMIFDQTTIRGIPTLLIGLVFEGRVLPVAFSCFTYRLIQKSQNILEHALIVAVMSCFPVESRPLLIMDRGYARLTLLRHLLQEGIPFLVRAKKNVVVYYRGQAKALSRFCGKTGKIQCYSVLYHSTQKIPLRLIIFRGKGYKETWYLLIPQDIPLSPKEVVDLYARRMSIEQGFRDWKTHLGVRGLVFYCDNPAPPAPVGVLFDLSSLSGFRSQRTGPIGEGVCGNPSTESPPWYPTNPLLPLHWHPATLPAKVCQPRSQRPLHPASAPLHWPRLNLSLSTPSLINMSTPRSENSLRLPFFIDRIFIAPFGFYPKICSKLTLSSPINSNLFSE